MTKKNNSVLVVAAHPDDEAIGCFGTLLKHYKFGDEINIIFLSDGVSSRGINKKKKHERKKNCLKVLKIIGLKSKNVFFLDYPDNMIDTVPLLDVIKNIEEIKKKIQPNVLYTHFSNDLNIDHRIAYQAAITASRPSKNETIKKILCFEIVSSTEWSDKNKQIFSPNYFVDISKFINRKLKALAIYDKEIKKSPNARSLENIKNLALLRGSRAGVNYAEAFFIERIQN
jgi:LmbE family N-acetylglucosaminyl deacetylase